AAIVVSELAEMGARSLLRVGTCRALADELELGRLVIVTEAIADDGTSRALGAGDRGPGDAGLRGALRAAGAAAPHPGAAGARVAGGSKPVAGGPVVSTDLFYDAPSGVERGWSAAGALAVEMETATVFTLAARRGLAAGSVLIVTDLLGSGSGARTRIEADAL